ncbi:VOC family protein [Granulibacter bethesdensis]|uniref:Lactoylglutathione lyase family protein n=2 Tax=Granulibacter bethesdensis TaxID=364410 RepID=Q0BVG6_GRABC|nr:VOC family protein [Granulibacter bethesdensis]ABI61186.1 Lactoylglutathione lyase family protein [Granulibacter bethesdensis CGDNIH1]AHJ62048.1 Lactoylglutathione lyase family protein [Granulibacter bethesdensis]AHJ64674.1 Lactoylglutathione lyase family protein [Granulibacter bethesdensis CGDNIH4]AHJ67290.1 Lactoylglutathione lyase family protein [Granulibacter bethesdensis]APH50967.1 Lactoylglutathione lyase family protein [Granulibacter bethesdensis]
MRFTIDRLDHLVMNVRDVEISASWYQRVLGMEREEFGTERRTALRFGGQKINLRPFDNETRSWSTAAHPQIGSDDLCFITAVGPDQVVEHLHDCGVTVEEGPVRKHGALGQIHSIYCRDPDGNLVEIASYLAE